MKNLLDKDVYIELTKRVQNLQPDSKAHLGKMNVSQMIAHVSEAYKVPLSETAMPRMFIGRLIGWAIKPTLYNDKAWKQNLPTAPNFVIKDERDFNTELLKLLNIIEKFHQTGSEKIGRYPHPMFGSFSTDQWGMAMYKHLDHHLIQFGV